MRPTGFEQCCVVHCEVFGSSAVAVSGGVQGVGICEGFGFGQLMNLMNGSWISISSPSGCQNHHLEAAGHEPLLLALSSASIARVKKFDPQGLANLSWSFATLQQHDPAPQAVSQVVFYISFFSSCSERRPCPSWAGKWLQKRLGRHCSGSFCQFLASF